MKIHFPLAMLLISLVSVLGAQDLPKASTLIPKADVYSDFLAFVKQIEIENGYAQVEFDVNPYEVLINAHRDNAVLLLLKAHREAFPDDKFYTIFDKGKQGWIFEKYVYSDFGS